MNLPDKTNPQPASESRVKAPVASGVKKVDRPARKRFLDYLFAESPSEAGKKIGREIVVPRIKQGFEEAFNSFLAGMLWGGGQNRPSGSIVQGTVLRGAVNQYHNVQVTNQTLARQATVGVNVSSGNYQDLVIPTQQMAESILANMYDLLNQYRMVAVADLYELSSITPAPSDNAFGWTSLDGARISAAHGGYLLELPKPHRL